MRIKISAKNLVEAIRSGWNNVSWDVYVNISELSQEERELLAKEIKEDETIHANSPIIDKKTGNITKESISAELQRQKNKLTSENNILNTNEIMSINSPIIDNDETSNIAQNSIRAELKEKTPPTSF